MAMVRVPTLEERRLKALSRLEAQVTNYVAGVRDGVGDDPPHLARAGGGDPGDA